MSARHAGSVTLSGITVELSNTGKVLFGYRRSPRVT